MKPAVKPKTPHLNHLGSRGKHTPIITEWQPSATNHTQGAITKKAGTCPAFLMAETNFILLNFGAWHWGHRPIDGIE